jgi:hypothetical protein
VLWDLAVVLLAVAAAFLPLPRVLVDGLYARWWFPRLQALMTGVSNSMTFAVLDIASVIVLLLWLSLAARDLSADPRGRRTPSVWRVIWRTLTWSAALYLIFLATWGLNYQRSPLVNRLRFDPARVSPDRAIELTAATVQRVNALYAAAHKEGWSPANQIDAGLARAFETAQEDVGATSFAVVSRPRTSMLDAYFTRAGVAGMTDPYFLETLLASDLLPFERPMIVAHEWSHLAGITDEGEASLLGWIACLHGRPPHQYSAWLFLYDELAPSLPPAAAEIASTRLGDGPRRDIQAIHDRLRQHINPRVANAGWLVYDRYLKANHVEAGTASYGQVVQLILGTEFSSEWVPRLR